MRYCVTKVAVAEKNNEALNGKDLMIERKEQGRKVNKKTSKMEEILNLKKYIIKCPCRNSRVNKKEEVQESTFFMKNQKS